MVKNANSSFGSQARRPPLSILRSAYVAVRFAGIGFSSTDRWLAAERKTSAPDLSAWNRLADEADFRPAVTNREVEVLRHYADPYPVPIGRMENLSHDLSAILRSFDPYRATVFMGFSFGPIIVFGNSTNSVLLEEDSEGEIVRFQTVESLDVIDVLFMTWAKQGPYAGRAREFLCDTAERAFIQLNGEYEYDFDESIAIVPDGSIAAHADRVLLYQSNASTYAARVYPADLFKAGKLDLEPVKPLSEITHDGTANGFLVSNGGKRSFIEDVLRCSAATGTLQLIVCSTRDSKRLFVSRLDAAGLATFPPGGLTVL